jgi:glycyl-tRNA synthetase beta chain
MTDFLLELFSEEIPARMQENAAKHLHQALLHELSQAGLTLKDAKFYYTPRRLTVHIVGLDTQSQPTIEEKRGPKIDANEQALNGFLKITGLTKEQLEIRNTPKGDFYFANIKNAGQKTTDIIAKIVPLIIYNFPWPKSMRWGSSSLKWIRPLHHILCIFNQQIIDFTVDNIQTCNFTFGHRFLAPEKIIVTDFNDYQTKLTKAYVILNQQQRKDKILKSINEMLADKPLSLIHDEGLLNEVTGLVEYPVPLMGHIQAEFQDLPPELLTLTMKTHQKYFSVQSNDTGKITHFITISNMKSVDNGATILNGNQRVLAARLNDAQFFYQQDLTKPLLDHGKQLNNVTYHAKLGSQVERIHRIAMIAEMLAIKLYPDLSLDDVKHTISLMKCDLTTQIVGEFPELQGIIGRYYALAYQEKPNNADAIYEHYLPKGAGDKVPHTQLGIVAALADRIEQLCGFWAINEKPTGSKDPYALRRAALGIIRIIHINQLDLELLPIIGIASNMYQSYGNIDIIDDLFQFFHDRIKVYLKDFDIRHDYVQSVLFGDNFNKIIQNAHIINRFINETDGVQLLANYKRVSNIVKAEEKKDKQIYKKLLAYDVCVKDFTTDFEIKLLQQLTKVHEIFQTQHDFTIRITELTSFNQIIINFFDNLIVNHDNPTVRIQRLNLLGAFRELCESICEFSKIETIS